MAGFVTLKPMSSSVAFEQERASNSSPYLFSINFELLCGNWGASSSSYMVKAKRKETLETYSILERKGRGFKSNEDNSEHDKPQPKDKDAKFW